MAQLQEICCRINDYLCVMKYQQTQVRPEELRIGNYVMTSDRYVDSYCPIAGVTSTSVYIASGKKSYAVKFRDIRAIPLTKEILNMWCGFVVDEDRSELKKDKLKVLFGDECCPATVHFGRCCRHIKALHELQNIYYAVMGRDMAVTPDRLFVEKVSRLLGIWMRRCANPLKSITR